ncbi:UDP-N-acetylmuramate dehydrogenase [Rheinheimera sp. UJ51]|uniref:UDP-N-acetylmuramate dehydrogenase n=1 Tax=Rheinheimera sp. UJ51 TaxID=2892446 RepID=UPI001E2DDDB2|nr:UDP-N-acetylmuramate dehydrogenase [Rheinheimera sp. UJ51]MCC5453267.1 UDP-N-acetylmuramate dehydrogenase [Rheinheimera sp. UJ51]
MLFLQDQAAEAYSTFRLKTSLQQVIEVQDVNELNTININSAPIILGEGSNTIFLTEQSRPILRFTSSQRTILNETLDTVNLHVEAGHNWHQLVSWAVNSELWGIENLALIPGSVGAAPIQNIGAYGVEFADVCDYVDFYSWTDQAVHRFSADECQFGYRDSLFKQSLTSKGLVIAVGITLQKKPKRVLNYAGLDTLSDSASLQEIYAQVIATRQSKLPDYTKLANCGSFFKNPIISLGAYRLLQQQFPKIPGYIVADNVKVPAAWLIDQLGFKGYRLQDIGCYERQPLVLVNFGNGTADALLALVNMIIGKVKDRYAILLEPEVRMLNKDGMAYVQS